ncbi:erythromycin esterase [Candidatus Endobugula sertula]|uniref:Erythromycin esterase n=1 Tax=Candidatus Endobugula sertula TaxID=62101 RepID=A0A1D2QSD3_9GAMM|nr:erythromycin esterase [Candidatus Endobugula sertula]
MNTNIINSKLVSALEKYAIPIGGSLLDYDPIIDAAKDKQFVLIGEASHGTKEFYRARAEITQRLIEEVNFDAVAVEADWPDAYTVNRYVSNPRISSSANNALKDFERFPTWMWRNIEVMHFIEWLFAYNYKHCLFKPETINTVGFYGLDLYSMSTSVHAVIDYLDRVDPKEAKQARKRYSCLDHFLTNPQDYGYATEFGLSKSCEKDIITQLIELQKNAFDYMKQNGLIAKDEYFCAEQNAKLVKNAEVYYRSMFKKRSNSWNIRDQHMFETLEDLTQHLSKQHKHDARIIVWAHNSHVGNAAATDMSRRGELNIGQLMRSQYGKRSLLVGFSTCRGTVTAASDWDSHIERKRVREPLPNSYEEVFHHVNHKQFILNLQENNEAIDLLMEPRLQRAIGVIYRPETERQSHYYYSSLPQQFDFILHYDETHAVKPLATTPHWHRGEMDETYPTGL